MKGFNALGRFYHKQAYEVDGVYAYEKTSFNMLETAVTVAAAVYLSPYIAPWLLKLLGAAATTGAVTAAI